MTETADVIVLGLGAMGSAALYQLAKRGIKAIGIDRFAPPHTMGSSHGDTRIVRKATGESMAYTPLGFRAYDLWHELEAEIGEKLITTTGLLLAAPGEKKGGRQYKWLSTAIEAGRQFDIPHEVLSPDDLAKRFPQFRLGETRGYYEPGAGFVPAEHCIELHLKLAEKRGARMRLNERAMKFTATPGGISLMTDKGSYAAQKLIVTAGPWMADFFPRYAGLLTVYRQVMYWFDVTGDSTPYLPGTCPVYAFAHPEDDDNHFYGFPAVDGARDGLKMGDENFIVPTAPDKTERTVSETEMQAFSDKYVQNWLPGLNRRCVKAATCLFTVTPDHHFIIDALPEDPRVIMASPCSGRGFKYATAIGEALVEIALDGKSTVDLSAFSLSRFGRV